MYGLGFKMVFADQHFIITSPMNMSMYTCWDCERFGHGCEGRLLDWDRRNRMETECRHFIVNAWRSDIYQRSGTRRL